MSIMRHNSLEPGSIQPLKLEWRNGFHYTMHLSSRKRNQVRITVHKADPLAIGNDLNNVA